MPSVAYLTGKLNALIKLGMKLEFDNPQQQAQHMKTRGRIGAATGLVGNLAGSTIGGAAGTIAGGPVGSIAGGVAGGAAGEAITSAPFTTAYDAAHDVKQRAGKQYRTTLQQLNTAAGMPR